MRLIELRLRNFRQFYGEQEISFAHSHPKLNVTVVHGYNGAGKTAFLNAFVWCLYGKTTPDLEAPERLVNERALSETTDARPSVEVSVKIRFKVRGEVYVAERTVSARRGEGATIEQDEPRLSLWRSRADGESEQMKGPQDAIDRVLPGRLHPFFFFNGERVEQLASPDAYKEVEEAVTVLLNVEIYDRGAKHLREARVELSKELRQHVDHDTQVALDEVAQLDSELASMVERQRTIRENDAALSSEIEAVELAQRETAALRELALKRDSAQSGLQQTQKRLDELRSQGTRALSRNGYLAFAEEVFSITEQLVSSARQRGDLPAKVKPQFVDDLLREMECICGRPIAEHSAEFQKLSKWRATGLAQLDEAIAQSSGALIGLRDRRVSYFETIEQCQADTDSARADRRRFRDEISELEGRLGSTSLGEAAELEQKHQELIRNRETVRVDARYMSDKQADLEAKIETASDRIKKLKLESQKAELVQHQMKVADNIINALQEIYNIQKQDVREELATSISNIWSDAAVKDYHASVTDDFRLELTKRVGGMSQPVHGASTGEKQVLALSFVGSLARKARQNDERNEEEASKLGGKDLIVGGEYPLVMDSPFGALEDDYRRKVAEWIPNLASQVVVLASNTQWRDEVERAMRPRIGREYILELHTPKDNADRSIAIAGREYRYVVSSSEAVEQTQIQEVK